MVILTETPPRKIADSLPGLFLLGKGSGREEIMATI
jgi:hypothetical protein